MKESHCCCNCKCLIIKDKVLIEAMQKGQDAQAGHACDFCIKRQPMAFNEVKKCCKGHSTLAEHIRQELVQRQGKRHAIRIMNDAYGKGIVCGQVENTSLRAYTRDNYFTGAASINTCQTDNVFGQNYVDMILRLNDKHISDRHIVFSEFYMRSDVHIELFATWPLCMGSVFATKESGIYLLMNLCLTGRLKC